MVQMVGTTQPRALRKESLRHVRVSCQWAWEWPVEVIVLILPVVVKVIVTAVKGVIIVKARGWRHRQHLYRQQWTWSGCPRSWGSR